MNEKVDLVEQVARAMCIADGLDPEEMGYDVDLEESTDDPNWRNYVNHARMHIAAFTVISGAATASGEALKHLIGLVA